MTGSVCFYTGAKGSGIPYNGGMKPISTWIRAARPWSFPASSMPVCFGTALAVAIGGAAFRLVDFLLALLGMVILHAAANLLSDVHDFRRGLDREALPMGSAIPHGLVTDREAFVAASLLFTLGSAIGLLLVTRVGLPVLGIGIAGVAVGLCYTPMKYHALGDLAVFLNFGVLGALGAWTVQTGSPDWRPAAWSVPISLLVIAILHANNWRDIASDGTRGARTVASLLGPQGSRTYYGFLLFAPFALVLLFVALGYVAPGARLGLPPVFLATALALPLALDRWKKAVNSENPKNPLDFIALDGATAQLNLVFGLLSTGAALFVL